MGKWNFSPLWIVGILQMLCTNTPTKMSAFNHSLLSHQLLQGMPMEIWWLHVKTNKHFLHCDKVGPRRSIGTLLLWIGGMVWCKSVTRLSMVAFKVAAIVKARILEYPGKWEMSCFYPSLLSVLLNKAPHLPSVARLFRTSKGFIETANLQILLNVMKAPSGYPGHWSLVNVSIHKKF